MVDRFRIDKSPEEVANLLVAAYKVEVESRQRFFILDNATSDKIIALANYITDPRPRFAVMLCGYCGNGKSTLMYAFRDVINLLHRQGFFGSKFIGLQIVDSKDILKRALDHNDFENLRLHPMLGIDDLGNESTEILNYGNVISPVIDLIEKRYKRQGFTFVTTNLTNEQLVEKYGERIFDRFMEMMEIIPYENESYRQ